MAEAKWWEVSIRFDIKYADIFAGNENEKLKAQHRPIPVQLSEQLHAAPVVIFPDDTAFLLIIFIFWGRQRQRDIFSFDK